MIIDIGAALQIAELMTLSKTIKRFVAVNAAFNHKPFFCIEIQWVWGRG